MRTKVMIMLVGFMIVSSIIFAMDNKQFDNLMSDINKRNYDAVEIFLKKNETSLRQDPDYYVLLLNYVLLKGDLKQLVIAKGKPQEGDFSLNNLKTSETEGFIGERGGYDEKLIISGISKT
jgi:hypothetical protein